jgi:AcrR family transcriptional regulator
LIVATAIAVIDENDNRYLTMRDLGEALDVEAMALYRYVNGREDLLEAVIAALLKNVTDELHEALHSTWQGYLRTLAHAIRRIAVEHPGAFPLVATRQPAAPWLRPPLRSLELVKDFLNTLAGYGFTDEQVARAYRTFSSFLLGHLLLEAAARRAHTSALDEPLGEGEAQIPNEDGTLAPGADDTVRHFQPLLSEDRSEDEFVITLETLLDRLELSLSQ